MAKENSSSIAFKADVSQFTQSINQMRDDIKLINSSFEASASELKDWGENQDKVKEKIESLNKVLADEETKLVNMNKRREEYSNTLKKNEAKLAELTAEYNKVVAAEGDSSASAKKLAKERAVLEKAITSNKNSIQNESVAINKQQTTINKTKTSIKQYEGNLKNLKKGLDSTGKSTKDLDGATASLKDGLKGIGKGVAAGITAIGAAATAAAASFLALAESTREYRTDLARLSTNAEMAGMATDDINSKLKELNQITGETDSNVEALSNLLQAGFTKDTMSDAIETLSDAVISFPDTLKVESLADSLQESIQQMNMGNNATGQYAELLERLGYNLDTVKAEFSGLSTEEEKQAYLLDLVNDKIGGTSDAYKEQHKNLIDAADAQFEFNRIMSEFGDSAEPIVSLLKLGFVEVLTQIQPLVTQVAEAFTSLLSGDIQGGLEQFGEIFTALREKANEAFIGMLNGLSEIIPELLPKIVEFLSQMVQQFVEFTPVLLDAALQLLGALIQALPPTIIKLVEQLPTLLTSISEALTAMIPSLLENAIAFLMTIVQALPSVVESLAQALPKLIETILGFLLQNLPVVFEGFLKLLMSIVDAVPSVVVEIVKALPKLITSIVKTIASNIPKLFATFIDMWLQLVKAIPEIIPKLLTGIGDIITSISESFDTDMLFDIGVSIIEGLWDGIKSLKDWLQKKLESAADWLPKWVKDKLGIASPSKVFKEIGKFSADGLGIGFTDEMKKVKKSIVNAVDMNGVGINGNVTLGSSGNARGAGKNVTLNYTVNSPTPLSRREVYQQARKMKTLLSIS